MFLIMSILDIIGEYQQFLQLGRGTGGSQRDASGHSARPGRDEGGGIGKIKVSGGAGPAGGLKVNTPTLSKRWARANS